MTVPHAQAYIDVAIGLAVCVFLGGGVGLLVSLFRHTCPECGSRC